MSYMLHIVMYGLRLLIFVLQELLNCLHVSIITVRGFIHFTKFRLLVSEIANVLPEGVYCCFINHNFWCVICVPNFVLSVLV